MSSSADERWILCGGANHASAPEDALRLAVSGPDANLTVDIEGHTAYGRNRCATDLVDEYLISGRTPDAARSCPAD